MADMMILRVLLALLGGTQILRAEPSPSPTVKSAGSSLASVVAGSSKPTRAWDKPYFDDISTRNVTAIVGQKAVLSCHVKHPGNRTNCRPPGCVCKDGFVRDPNTNQCVEREDCTLN